MSASLVGSEMCIRDRSYTARITGTFNVWLRQLDNVIREDLQSGVYCQSPPDHFRGQSSQLLRMTLLRAKHVRGRSELESPAGVSDIDALADGLLEIFNGDWRRPCLQHFCRGSRCRCGGDREALLQIARSLLGALFSMLAAKLPATNRWYTFGPALASQSLLCLLHSVLPRVRRRAPSMDVDLQANAGLQDWEL
eukprot:13339749-Alexandrium_andersonii.AAC.1